jgi:hypothetical protein
MGHREQQSQKSANFSLDLEQCIEFEKERISRQSFVIHSVRFHLDKDVLLRIKEAQETGLHFYLSGQLLADLREYALISQGNSFQSGLTFYTYYLRGGAQDALMRSVISTDGDIFHQIKGDCLERPNFCRQVASAHYWIIAQLMSQLRLGAFLKLNLLSWLLAFLITVIVLIPLILLVIRVNLWLLLPLLIFALILLIALQRLLLPIVRRLIFQQVLSGLLSRPWKKKIAKAVLARFVT